MDIQSAVKSLKNILARSDPEQAMINPYQTQYPRPKNHGYSRRQPVFQLNQLHDRKSVRSITKNMLPQASEKLPKLEINTQKNKQNANRKLMKISDREPGKDYQQRSKEPTDIRDMRQMSPYKMDQLY